MSGSGSGLGAGGLGLVPGWLGVGAALVFLAVTVVHLRHIVLRCATPRRCWHWSHALMAFSMVLMYLPAALDPLHVPAAGWQALFLVALLALAASGAVELGERRMVSGLWLLVALDFGAMLYMWSPGAFSVPVTGLVCAYLVLVALVWGLGRVALLDRPLGAALTLTGERELRLSMTVMAGGMAYMVLATQLAR